MQDDGLEAVPCAVNTILTLSPGAIPLRPRTKATLPVFTTVAPLIAVTEAFGILKASAHLATGCVPLLAMVAVALKPPGVLAETRKAMMRPSARPVPRPRSPGPRWETWLSRGLATVSRAPPPAKLSDICCVLSA